MFGGLEWMLTLNPRSKLSIVSAEPEVSTNCTNADMGVTSQL